MREVRLYNCKELPHFLTGIFLLLAKFPKEYPYKPPEIRFVTPVCIYYISYALVSFLLDISLQH